MSEREFSIGKVAEFFLDRTPAWVRWRERQGILVNESGEPIGSRRENSKIGNGDRFYTILDVRQIAHALRRANVLDDRGLRVVIQRIEAMEQPVFKKRRRKR